VGKTARDPRLESWIRLLLATPGLTASSTFESAWELHVEDALTGLPLVSAGPVVDVGSGGGSPGLPLAAARPDLQVHLLESSRRKCDFLETATAELPNVRVVCSRAEDWGRADGRDAYGTAVARALAPQAVAAEWCLPLVRPGGRLVLYAGEPAGGLAAVAEPLAAAPPRVVPVRGTEGRTLLVFEKLDATPERFPRRAGAARKRPLG
jgi:16S rRNA (guanine527-N7)-methyltransferase